MQNSVLTLGEKIVLAARLAAIEHVRQEIGAIEHARREDARPRVSGRAIRPVGDRAIGIMDESDPVAFSKPVPALLGDVFRRIEAATPSLRPKSVPQLRKRGAA